MFDLEQAIAEWRRQMVASGLKTPESLDELENHLREDALQRAGSGLPPAEAFEIAARQLGNAAALNLEFSMVGSMSRGYSIAVNVLGVWFLLMSLISLTNLYFRIFRGGLDIGSFGSVVAFLFPALQILTEIGLLRRQNRWRMIALLWCVWSSYGNVTTLVTFREYYRSFSLMAARTHILPELLVFQFTAMFLFFMGVWVLSRPDVRNCFLHLNLQAASLGEPPTIWSRVEAWLKQGLLLVLYLALASLALVPAQLLSQNDVDAHSRHIGLGAIAVLILAFAAGRGRYLYGLFPKLETRGAGFKVRLACRVLSAVWAAGFVGIVRLSNLDFGETLAGIFWALTPLAAILTYHCGEAFFKIETALSRRGFGNPASGDRTRRYA